MKKAVIFVLMSALVSTNALAWGDREQGALAGMAALWAFQRLNQVDTPPRVVYTQPQTVYVERPVVVLPQVVEYQRQHGRSGHQWRLCQCGDPQFLRDHNWQRNLFCQHELQLPGERHTGFLYSGQYGCQHHECEHRWQGIGYDHGEWW